MTRRLKILLSSYACGPNRGSEPGVGWNVANALSTFCDVHVLTQSECRADIEAEIKAGRVPDNLHFHYFETPFSKFVWRNPNEWKIRIHYQLWQIMAGKEVRRLHALEHFDAAQHVTFVRYWGRSCLASSGIPYVFGPVGGAEFTPKSLLKCLPMRGRLFEKIRGLVRFVSELSPGTRRTLRNAFIVLATTRVSANRCIALRGESSRVFILGESALSDGDIRCLGSNKLMHKGMRFVCLGRLIAWKGYALAVEAFALADIKDSVLELIGDGPERDRLLMLCQRLGVSDRVFIRGNLPRKEVLQHLHSADVLVHPSMHDSGGWACLEGMAAGLPVVCLDWGGPATQVPGSAGFRIPIGPKQQVVEKMAESFRQLCDPVLRAEMSKSAASHVQRHFTWEEKAKCYCELLTATALPLHREPESLERLFRM